MYANDAWFSLQQKHGYTLNNTDEQKIARNSKNVSPFLWFCLLLGFRILLISNVFHAQNKKKNKNKKGLTLDFLCLNRNF